MRLPAAFSGIAGIKPTSGRLPRTGHFPPAGGWIETLWQIGPMARRVEDLIEAMRLLTGPDGIDPTVPDVPFREPDGVNLAELRVAFYTDNGFSAADDEVSAVVRAAAGAVAPAVRAVTEARPACLPAAYDLEMKLIGPDGGDGLRAYLRDIGSTEVHPLLTGWLDKLGPYRTDLAGLARYWSELDAYRAEMTRIPARLRRDSVPRLHSRRTASRRVHPRRKFPAASATPWRSTWRDGRARWCGAANRATGCRSPCR